MTPQLSQKPWKAAHRWQRPLLPFAVAAVTLIATVASVRLASAAECQVIEAGGTSQGLTNWEDTTLRSLPLTLTVDRDLYRGRVSSPVREIATDMNSRRMGLGKMEDQEIATIGACLSQDIRESALFKRAMITSLWKAQAKAHAQIMKFSTLPYKGKKQGFMTRMTQPEIGISVRKSVRTIIAPVPELQKSILPDAQSVSQPVDAVYPHQNPLQLPGNESLRMNLTTAQEVPDGNCADGCP